jgi:hypothetical protein
LSGHDAELIRRRNACRLLRQQQALVGCHGRVLAGRLQGGLVRLTFGAKYAYIKREAFPGIGGSPTTDDSVVMTSIRYYPF